MKKLQHIHLTRLHEVIDSPEDDKMFLVLEFVPNGQVMDWEPQSSTYINRDTGKVLTEESARKLAADITLGVEYCKLMNRSRLCCGLIMTPAL